VKDYKNMKPVVERPVLAFVVRFIVVLLAMVVFGLVVGVIQDSPLLFSFLVLISVIFAVKTTKIGGNK
jgi:VIT1/CCC1 family predicted Fe2+/Mn2+ transporter